MLLKLTNVRLNAAQVIGLFSSRALNQAIIELVCSYNCLLFSLVGLVVGGTHLEDDVVELDVEDIHALGYFCDFLRII